MKHENVTLSTEEMLKSKERMTDCMNEQIAAAMLLLAAVENELGRLNEIEDEALEKNDAELQKQYDADYDKFNITVSFKNHTVEIGLQCMDAYDSFIGFLLDYINNADIYR